MVTDELLKQLHIGTAGNNFQRSFCGKLVRATPCTVLIPHMLQKESLDESILEQFGAGDKVSLSCPFWLLQQHAKGHSEVLQVNGNPNVFYVEDEAKRLLALAIYWTIDVNHWTMEAFPLNDPWGWGEASQFFRRAT
jgi:hypothetical protein